MSDALHFHLSRRESQIMDVVYRLGEASAEEVSRNMPEETSYDSVRVTLGILERKGFLTHRRESNRHVFRPSHPPEKAKRTVLRHVLRTFFQGSTPGALSTLLDMSAAELTDAELEELSEMLEKAKEERKR